MTELRYFRAYSDIDATFAFTAFAPGATPLQFVFNDVVSGATRGTITFTADAGGVIRSGLVEDGAGDDLIALTGLSLGLAAFAALVGGIATEGDLYPATIALLDDDTTVTGSAFADELETGAGDDTVNAGAGDDILYKWSTGDLSANGGKGIDTLDFTPARFAPQPAFTHALVVDLGAGTGTTQFGGSLTLSGIEEVVTIENVADTVFGSAGDDAVYGGGAFGFGGFAAGDRYALRGGDDLAVIAVFQGNASITVEGGAGTDTLRVREITGPSTLDLADPAGNAGVFAGSRFTGIEILELSTRSGLAGTTDIIGGDGAETVRFLSFPLFPGNPVGQARMDLGGGNDSAHGGRGDDTLDGGRGDDTLSGTSPGFSVQDADSLDGGTGNDALDGGGGDDRIAGGEGADTLLGGAGDDSLLGGSGRDVLSGGRDRDRMAGDGGADDFVFAAGFGRDRIADFAVGLDDLDFRGHAGVATLADLAITDSASGAVIADPDGARVILLGVRAADLLPGDILV